MNWRRMRCSWGRVTGVDGNSIIIASFASVGSSLGVELLELELRELKMVVGEGEGLRLSL